MTTLACVCLSASAVADTSTGWISSAAVSVADEGDASPPHDLNGNIDCFNYDPSTGLCSVATAFGAVRNCAALVGGTLTYHLVEPCIMGVPNSDTVLTYTTEPVYGARYYFTKNFPSAVSQLASLDTSLKYQFIRQPDGRLADRGGNFLHGFYDSISF